MISTKKMIVVNISKYIVIEEVYEFIYFFFVKIYFFVKCSMGFLNKLNKNYTGH